MAAVPLLTDTNMAIGTLREDTRVIICEQEESPRPINSFFSTFAFN